jgi:elongation factor P--(R)-beta-lysine ligase
VPLLPSERKSDQLQRYQYIASLPFVFREDRPAQALRRLRLAPAQALAVNQAGAVHGDAALRRPINQRSLAYAGDFDEVLVMKKENIILRSNVVKAIRRFFDERDFLEMHTPRLIALPGQEPYLEPMWTTVHRPAVGTIHELSLPAGLITSPEYAMKRLLASGLDRIYDLGSCFRDGEPWDGTHDPEFLLLEWYRRDAGLDEIIKDTEDMIRFVVDVVGAGFPRPRGTDAVGAIHPSTVASAEIDELPLPAFRRLTVKDAMRQYAHLDLDEMIDHPELLHEEVKKRGYTATEHDTWDDLFFKLFLSEVEPKLGWKDPSPAGEGSVRHIQPTFLTHYPASMAALARRDPTDPRYALRTELYIGDLELANGFAELADPVEQRKRFEEERELRQKLGKKTWSLDERFLEDLSSMGNAAGIAFGVDRLVMLLAGAKSISDILPIPVGERLVAKEEGF